MKVFIKNIIWGKSHLYWGEEFVNAKVLGSHIKPKAAIFTRDQLPSEVEVDIEYKAGTSEDQILAYGKSKASRLIYGYEIIHANASINEKIFYKEGKVTIEVDTKVLVSESLSEDKIKDALKDEALYLVEEHSLNRDSYYLSTNSKLKFIVNLKN